MEMKKISCAVLIAAASISAAMAVETVNSVALAPGANTAASGVAATLPVFGSLVGASLVSFFAYCLQYISQIVVELRKVYIPGLLY
ncbi:hypothetical protein EZV62_010724 [Acer yangbiense]|uniref:CASP-like protein n=1 Tax=Acer yangbiense TaxID=1000413 RepID=A0A5C7I3D8_9ROSI|nr:hypothetical protein EZV62_010724 [Acer yangbiense]